MNQITGTLSTGGSECQALYKQIQEFWRINISQLFKFEANRRTEFAKTLKEKFNSDFSKVQKEIIAADLFRMAKALLGCNLVVLGKPLEISMVEIYADGIFDEAGDLIKGIYGSKMSTVSEKLAKEHNPIDIIKTLPVKDLKFLNKILPGPRIYLYSGRLDIIILGEYLPFSFLIRQLINEKGNPIDLLGLEENVSESIKTFKTVNIDTIRDFGSSWVICDFLNEDQEKTILRLSRQGGILGKISNPEIYLLDKSSNYNDPKCTLRIESNRHTGLCGDFKKYSWNLQSKPKHTK